MLIFPLQVLAIAFIVQCLGPSIVIGRPHTTEMLVTGMKGRLRDNMLRGNALRFKRFLQTRPLRGDLRDILVKETNNRHLERIKRQLAKNPCLKRGSFERFQLSNGQWTYKVECEANSNVGCFHSILIYTTAKCTDIKVVFPQTGQTLVQDCTCAS